MRAHKKCEKEGNRVAAAIVYLRGIRCEYGSYREIQTQIREPDTSRDALLRFDIILQGIILQRVIHSFHRLFHSGKTRMISMFFANMVENSTAQNAAFARETGAIYFT